MQRITLKWYGVITSLLVVGTGFVSTSLNGGFINSMVFFQETSDEKRNKAMKR